MRAGTILHRIHRLIHAPLFFGPSANAPEQRYDDPDGLYKVLYAARDLPTAFGETLVRVPTITDIVSTDVMVRGRSELATTRPLRLFPLLDERVSAHGLSFTELHGSDYGSTWRISSEIHADSDADGILYTSRFTNRQCVALFDRARGGIAATAIMGVALTPELAADLAGRFGKTYVEP